MATMTRTTTETWEVPDLGQVAQDGWVLLKPIDPRILGGLIEQARKLKRPAWSQSDLAVQMTERFGGSIGRTTISAWESGKNVPPMDYWEALVAVLNPPGGLNWFASAYSPALREARGLHVLEGVPDPWAAEPSDESHE
jgi:transcriptional regulator with XRE-family HTH domain